MAGTAKRIVLCMGPYCNASGRAEPLADRLKAELGDPCPAFMAHGADHWEIANCLSMCGGGPNLIVYPAGEEYHYLDQAALEDALAAHLGDVDQTDHQAPAQQPMLDG